MKIKPPFSVNVAAEVALKTSLNHLSYYQDQVAEISSTRDRIQGELMTFNQLDVFPSRANFILCRVNGASAKTLHNQLESKGILVRYFNTDLLRNYIRISMGTKEQMKRFIVEMRSLIG